MTSSARFETQFALMSMYGLAAREKRREVTRLLSGVFQRLTRRLNPATVLEIGAHEASFAAAMKRLLPESDIIAFEANPAVHAEHAARLSALKVDYRNLAVSSREGRVSFSIPTIRGEMKTTHAGLLDYRGAEDVTRIEVDSVSLDSLPLRRPAVLWIDVEGALREVLGGAESMLRETLAVYVELDVAPHFSGCMQAQEAIAFLEQKGFVGLARDVQKPIQFNGLFVHSSIASDTISMRALGEFYEGLGRLAGINLPGGSPAAPAARPRGERQLPPGD